MLKPVAVLLPGMAAIDPARLAKALRAFADVIDAGHAKQSPFSGLRRPESVSNDEGNGIHWHADGFDGHLYSWNRPTLEIEIMVQAGAARTIRLRHPMPLDLRFLRDNRARAIHMRRLADLATTATALDDPRAARYLARLDEMAEACAAMASLEPIPGNRFPARIAAPSPFARGDESFAYDATRGHLRPSREMIRAMTARLPRMVQFRRIQGDRGGDILYGVEAIATHVDASQRSISDVMRAQGRMPAEIVPAVTWFPPA